MILLKKLNSKEVLETIAEAALKTVPEEMEGTLTVQYDDEDGVEIYFVQDYPTESIN